uniref:Uncharacterized protein n=1 Tax=Meloidogyne incognita TaxID=6306 RepID=A0A914N3G7_MELIC
MGGVRRKFLLSDKTCNSPKMSEFGVKHKYPYNSNFDFEFLPTYISWFQLKILPAEIFF